MKPEQPLIGQKNFFRFDFWHGVTIFALALAVLFLIYPYAGMFFRSFTSGRTGEPSLENYRRFFTFAYYYMPLFRSLRVSFSATFLAVLLGVPMAYVFSRYNIAGKKLLKILIVISLLSPPFIGAYSWIILLGRNGYITRFILEVFDFRIPSILGFNGLLLVFTLRFFPFVFLFVSGALGSIDSSLEEAAENLGVRGLRKLFTITFPLILPTISAGAVMVFMTSLADLGTPLLIGEGFKVLPVLIYEEFLGEVGVNPAMASALSVIIVSLSLSILLLQKFVISKRNYAMSSLRPPVVKELRLPKRIILTISCYLIGLFAILPQITIIIMSFRRTRGPLFVRGFSLDSYRNVWFQLSGNISRTFLYGLIAIIIMIILGMLVSYLIVRRPSRVTSLIDSLYMSPYVIPGAVVGILLVMAFNQYPIRLTGTGTIIVIAYVMRRLPHILRSSTAILYQLDPAVEEASINLGVPPLKTFFKITAVMMAPGVISGAILSWIAAINELSATIILFTGWTSTIPIAIYTEILRDSSGTAAALATILIFATVLSLLIFNRFTKGKGSVV
ncbi:MAG: iron ABC transporter permease [Treponema sp.]|nr:iron ABC transporter permease [Treponema sp.]